MLKENVSETQANDFVVSGAFLFFLGMGMIELSENQKEDEREAVQKEHGPNLNNVVNYTASHAIKYVESKGHESSLPPPQEDAIPQGKRKGFWHHINWDLFIRLFSIWFASAVILFVIIVGLSVLENPDNLFVAAVSKTDVASLFFSLVLSTALEQVWQTNSSQKRSMLILVAELMLAFVGICLYLFFTIIHMFPSDPPNKYLSFQFGANLGFIISSFFLTVTNFLLRSYEGMEVIE